MLGDINLLLNDAQSIYEMLNLVYNKNYIANFRNCTFLEYTRKYTFTHIAFHISKIFHSYVHKVTAL